MALVVSRDAIIGWRAVLKWRCRQVASVKVV
jgi:hypothetical protein